MSTVKHMDLSLNDCNLNVGIKQIITTLRPEWPESGLKFKQFSGGFTNRLIGVYLADNPNDKVLIRIYGEKTELFIDRQQELKYLLAIHNSGIGAPVYCTFNNGLSYGYFPGVTVDRNLVMNDQNVSRLISEMCARIHKIRPEFNDNATAVGTEPPPCLFSDIRRFMNQIPDKLDDEREDKRLKLFLSDKQCLESEVDFMESIVKSLDSPIVFCHNDLLFSNIVFDSDKCAISFIDHEYANYNYQSFDIANHFCEFGGNDPFQPNLLPDKAYQIQWIRNYLLAFMDTNNDRVVNQHSIDEEVDTLYNSVQIFMLTSHLYWGLWSIFQTQYSAIRVDFMTYAIARLEEYYKRKSEFFFNNKLNAN